MTQEELSHRTLLRRTLITGFLALVMLAGMIIYVKDAPNQTPKAFQQLVIGLLVLAINLMNSDVLVELVKAAKVWRGVGGQSTATSPQKTST